MKREAITINESGNIIIQTINPSEIWMNEPELISFFNVIAPTFRAAVRTIYKKGILNPGNSGKTNQTERRLLRDFL